MIEDLPRTSLMGQALRRRWLLVLGSVAVFTAVAAGLALRASPQYVASASVFLQPIPGNALSPEATASGDQVTVAMQTEAGLLDSPYVVRRVRKVLHVPGDQLRTGVTATVPSNTKIVQIQYSASTPQAARAGAQAFAGAYLDFREALASEVKNRQMKELRAQVDDAKTELAGLVGKADSSAMARRQVLTSWLDTLQSSVGQLEATDVHPGVVSSPARIPDAPAGLNPLYLLPVGALLGLAVGIVLAVGREASDDTVRPSEGTFVAGLPVLSELERCDPPATHGDQLGGTVVESYRRLRVGIAATVPDARSICICDSQDPGDASLHTLTLARVMCRAGLRVVVVDGTASQEVVDLVSDRLIGDEQAPAGALLDGGGAQPLTLVSARKGSGREAILDEVRLPRLVAQHRNDADFVLVAASSLSTADGGMAGLTCDCVLLIVEQGVTRARDVRSLLQRARVRGVSICGVFSVPPRRERSRGRGRLVATASRALAHSGARMS
ncbi:MAG TPA: Wzz/FepE/Etk N-terminal domain-containing protein [Marmoricola sp.]